MFRGRLTLLNPLAPAPCSPATRHTPSTQVTPGQGLRWTRFC